MKSTLPKPPRTLVVGLGRMGGAIAFGLSRARWPVWVLPRSVRSARRASALGLLRATPQVVQRAELCVLAVPDHAVAETARELVPKLASKAALVHCAGALSLTAFGRQKSLLRRSRGSFHPLCAVSGPEDDLSGHCVALAANRLSLLRMLRRMAADLGLRPFQVPEKNRILYHAAAVLSAGGVVALCSVAMEAMAKAVANEVTARGAILPLMRSALRGVEKRGLSGALTGPIARGDLMIVRAHLAVLPSHLLNVYRDLGLASLRLARSQLPPRTLRDFEALLSTPPHPYPLPEREGI